MLLRFMGILGHRNLECLGASSIVSGIRSSLFRIHAIAALSFDPDAPSSGLY